MDSDSNINPGPKQYPGTKNNNVESSTTLRDPFYQVDIKVEDINKSEYPIDVNFVSLNNQNTSDFADLYICHICGIHCETELLQKIHIQVHVDAHEIFPCTICNEHFDTQSILNTHMITTHNIIKVASSNEESDDDDDDNDYTGDVSVDDGDGDGDNTEISETSETSTSYRSELSKERYANNYNAFIKWKNENKIKKIDEKVLLNYFDKFSKKNKTPTLKSHYFMLKKEIQLNDGIDISCYKLLSCYIKKKSDGYLSTQIKVFTSKEIENFLNDAPDNDYLAVKVALIFGFVGACRCDELIRITIDDLEDDGSLLVVTIRPQSNRKQRIFTIEGEFYNIYKKYILLRPNNTKTNRLFLKLTNGVCKNVVIGENKFSRMPKEIAEYLNLPDFDLYTGGSFRRTSAKLLADSGVDMNTLKLHGGWKSENVFDFIKEAAKNRKLQTLKNTNNNNTNVIPRASKPTINFIPPVIKQKDIEPSKKKLKIDNNLPAASTSKPQLSSTPPPLTPITSTSSSSSSSVSPKNCVTLIDGNNFTITPTSQHILNFHNCQINIILKK